MIGISIGPPSRLVRPGRSIHGFSVSCSTEAIEWVTYLEALDEDEERFPPQGWRTVLTAAE